MRRHAKRALDGGPFIGHPQSRISNLAAQRNFALLRIRGAKALVNVFSPRGAFPASSNAQRLLGQYLEILDDLEKELDVIWLAKKKEIQGE